MSGTRFEGRIYRRIIFRQNDGRASAAVQTFKIEYNQKPKETAQILHIHLNTLSYRLKRIEEILGLDLSFNKHIHDIYLAINIYEMFREQIDENKDLQLA